jgi:hypothetical protein
VVLFGRGTAPSQPLEDNGQHDAHCDRYRGSAGLQQQSRCQNAGADQVLPGHFHIIPPIKTNITTVLAAA